MNTPRPSNIDYMTYTFEHLPLRGITKESMAYYNCLTKINEDGQPISIGFPYGNDATKVRSLTEKDFRAVGDMSNATLFGKERFSPGSSRSITITEGELDAISAFQMLGSGYPVVSVRSASSARKDCERERDYLNSFEKIYLCFDADAPGQKPLLEVAKLFDFNKVYHVKLSEELKDANAYLSSGKAAEFKRIWWNSGRFLPEGIIAKQSEFDAIIDNDGTKQGVSFPFKELHGLTYGIRTGETILFTAMEGIGKTEIIRAIEHHLLKTTDANLGLIHLEENKARSLKGLAGYELGSPVHLPDSQVSNDEIKIALASVLRRDERLHIYSHFGSSDPDVILDTIRFMVTSCGCKYIFLDHITMVVSGLGQDDERKALDYISTQLAMMVETLDFALIFVSHVNDEGKTRGSRNISKIADLWIHLDRDQQATNEDERNTTYLTIRKNRFAGRTGPSGKLRFDLSTYMISEIDPREIKMPPVEETV
jgi:twinkle protein